MPKQIQVLIDKELKNGAILRRYLDLAKFLDLLRSGAIYLTSTVSLPDKFEGALTSVFRHAIDSAYSKGLTDNSADDFIRKTRECNYINCWSLGATDNMALWQLYSSTSNGVAITTTKEKLAQACFNWAAEEHVEIFKVQYIDHFENPDMIIASYTDPLRFKHIAYRYEREVRIVVSRVKENEIVKSKPEGIRLPVKLDDFICSIVVAPEAGSWFYEMVSDITKRYGLSVPVCRSKLTYLPE